MYRAAINAPGALQSGVQRIPPGPESGTQQRPPEQPRTQPIIVSQPSTLISQSHERLIAWIYNIPVASPNILGEYQKSSLEQINQLLQSGQIARFEMSLMLQPWAGPPGTLNRVLTFQTIDGQKLFVVAQYNLQQTKYYLHSLYLEFRYLCIEIITYTLQLSD